MKDQTFTSSSIENPRSHSIPFDPFQNLCRKFLQSFKIPQRGYSLWYISIFSGGLNVNVTGKNLDSVEEPVMVVTANTPLDHATYYQVILQ